MIKCPKCGKELPKEARFCPYCMYRFIEDKNTMPIDYTAKKNLASDNKIKRYILLAVVFFIFMVAIGLTIYGNIVIKSPNDENQNNTYSSELENVQSADMETASNQIDETDKSGMEQITIASKPTRPSAEPTTEPSSESTSELPTESTTEPPSESTSELPTESTTEPPSEPTTEPSSEPTTEPSVESTTAVEESTSDKKEPTEPIPEQVTEPTTEKEETTSGKTETETSTEDDTDSYVCNHIYTNVTCISSSVCVLCGTVAYEALGHDYVNKTCTSGGYCSRCGVKGMVALEHIYEGPLCQDVKCSNCDSVRKASAFHWYTTPCYEEGACFFCGEIGMAYHYALGDGFCEMCGDEPLCVIPTIKVGKTYNLSPETWINLTVGSDYKFDIIRDRNSKYYGRTVVGIPITHDRTIGVLFRQNDYTGYIRGFYENTPCPFVSEYFEDGFRLIVSEEEKNVTEYYYILYDGDGIYRIVFNSDGPDIWQHSSRVVEIEIKK